MRRNYATAQHIGGRSLQCDATVVRTAPSGARAYVLLDGIGTSAKIRDWTRRAAVRLAQSAARHADAETALRALYEQFAADPDRQDPYQRQWMAAAAAVVAVAAPGEPLTMAWCGDCRAYLLEGGIARRLTEDHNLRRVYPPTATFPEGGNRHRITSYLGAVATDEEARGRYNHPAIESTTCTVSDGCRLVLASDGAYEPIEDAGCDLVVELGDTLTARTLRNFVHLAVTTSRKQFPEDKQDLVDNATVLVADLTP